MKIIYKPKGKALEYAPLACNLYTGCPHGCKYCYGPTLPNPAKKGLTIAEWRAKWHSGTVAKPDAIAILDHDLATMERRGDNRPVLLCFACDPYPPDEPIYAPTPSISYPMTEKALSRFRSRGITPIILTKGGTRACRDFDILKAAGGWFGQTMALEESTRMIWEPFAASNMDRAAAGEEANRQGIKTWLSVEPVLNEHEAVNVLTHMAPDHFKLGKLSGYDATTRAIERGIDWPAYREEARSILNAAGYTEIFTPGAFEVGTYYTKKELREAK